MEIKKSIQLTTEPLEELIRNGESLDFRLDQESWRELRPGDYIEFWEDFTRLGDKDKLLNELRK